MSCFACNEPVVKVFAKRSYCQRHWHKRVTGKFPEAQKSTRTFKEAIHDYYAKNPDKYREVSERLRKNWQNPVVRHRMVHAQKELGYRRDHKCETCV